MPLCLTPPHGVSGHAYVLSTSLTITVPASMRSAMPLAALAIAREHVREQAEVRVVREPHRLLLVLRRA